MRQQILEYHTSSSLTLGVIADTHGCLDPAIADGLSHCDLVLHAGDIGPHAMLRELRTRFDNLLVVAGNNDRGYRGEDGAVLPDLLRLQLPGGVLVMEHGHRINPRKPDHEALRAAHPDTRLVIYGHAHRQVFDCTQPTWVLNPGAAGRTRARNGASWARIRIEDQGSSWSVSLELAQSGELEQIAS